MIHVQRSTIGFVICALVGALLIVVATHTLNSYTLSILEFVGIYIILAVSLNITNGFAGLFSLGHPAFMAVGAYVCAILTLDPASKSVLLSALPEWLAMQQWAFLPALLAGGVFAAIVAAVVGIPVLRLRGHYLAVATLGLIFIIQGLAINLDGYTRGALGLYGLSFLTGPWWVYGWLLVTLYVCWRLKHSSLGRTMLAMRGNVMAAECLGVPVMRTRLLAFAVGAFFAGVCGGLWVHVIGVLTPTSFSVALAFHLIVMIVIGGSGSITGAAIAAILVTGALELFRPIEESLGLYGLSQILVAVGVLLVLIYRPEGFFGSKEPRFLVVPQALRRGPNGNRNSKERQEA